MALDAGSVFVTLGGDFDRRGFMAFDRGLNRSIASATSAERSHHRSARAISASYGAASKAIGASMAAGTAAVKASAVGVGIATVGITAALVKSVKLAATFEEQLSALGAVSGASAKQMKLLRQSALDAGSATKYSALEAAKAQTELAKGGLTTTQILQGGLTSALALAAAGELDLAEAAATTVNAMKLFGISGRDSMKVADALAAAANNTTADVGDFALALRQGGGAAKAAGLNFEETIVWLEALAESGIKGSDAGTSMKAALAQLAAPTAKQEALTKKLGLSFFDAEGSLKPLPQLASELGAKLEGMGDQQRLATLQTLAGTDGFRALLALVDTGPKKLTNFEKGVLATGTALDVAKKKQDNLAGSIEQLQGSLETAGVIIGTAFIPVVREAVDDFTGWVNQMSQTGQLDRFAQDAATKVGEVVDLFREGIPKAADFVEHIVDLGEELAPLAADKIEEIVDAIEGVVPYALDFAQAVADLAQGLGPIAADKVGDLAGYIQDAAPEAQTLAEGIAHLAEALAPIAASVIQEIADALVSAAPYVGEVADGVGGIADALGTENLATGAKAFGAAYLALKGIAALNAASIRMAANPILAIATLTAAAGVGIGAIARSMKDIGDEADDAAAALERLLSARDRLAGGQVAVKRAELDLDSATQDHADALGRLEAAERKVADLRNKGSRQSEGAVKAVRELNEARAAEADTALRVEEANLRLSQANDEVANAELELQNGSKELAKEFGGLSSAAGRAANQVAAGAKGVMLSGSESEKAAAQAEYAAAAVKAWAAEFRKGGDDMTAQAKTLQGQIADVAIELGRVPTETELKIIADTLEAGGDIDDIRDALGLLPKVTTPKVTADVAAAVSGIERVSSLLAALRDKRITVTTFYQSIAGGGNLPPVSARAKGTKTTKGQPQLAIIGEGAAPEYVIPTEKKYRARGIGLLMMAAKDLGLPGFKAGGRFSSGAADPEAARKAVETAEKAVDLWQDAQKDLNDANALEGRGPVNSKRKATAIAKAKTRLATLEKRGGDLKARNAKLRQARQNLAAIEKFESRQDARGQVAGTAQTEMDVAEGNGDKAAFEKARGRARQKIQGQLAAIATALKGNPSPARKRDLLQQRAELQRELQQLNAREYRPPSGPGPGDDDVLTDAEQEAIDQAEASFALAQVDTPGDTSDDIAAAQGIVAVREAILARLRASGASAADVADAANAVSSARDQVRSLTATKAPGDDPDLQAQLEQERRRREAAEAKSNAAADFITTMGQSGDLLGGGLALARIEPIRGQDGDRRVAEMSNGGNASVGFRPTTRFRTGV